MLQRMRVINCLFVCFLVKKLLVSFSHLCLPELDLSMPYNALYFPSHLLELAKFCGTDFLHQQEVTEVVLYLQL